MTNEARALEDHCKRHVDALESRLAATCKRRTELEARIETLQKELKKCLDEEGTIRGGLGRAEAARSSLAWLKREAPA